MWVNFSVLGSNTDSAPVDHTIPVLGSMRTVCLPTVSWYSITCLVRGSQRPSLLDPCSVSHTLPSGCGTAEWIAAVPMLGTGDSLISPVTGLRFAVLFAPPPHRPPTLPPFTVPPPTSLRSRP